MAIRVTEATRGMIIRFEGELYRIEKYDHVTPGNWRAIHHLHLRNLKTGRQKQVRMNTSDQIDPVFTESRTCQYLYKDANGYVFMDDEHYEQFHLPEDVLKDTMSFIMENDTVDVLYADGEALVVQLPAAVELEVVEAEEAARGDTVSNVQKPVKLATGLSIKAPAHIKVGDRVRVNTETGEFLGRAS
ncbi:MAG: elongation factor P [Planctomycetes bacterium]|nr:elongation factor P [Planctomycetota bacterium]